MTRKPQRVTVAEYLTHAINMSGIAQKDLADAIGYEKPNMITMLKQGKTKLPIPKVGLIAKALHVDPVDLLRRVYEEYDNESWLIIKEIIGNIDPISSGERKVIDLMRRNSGGFDLAPQNETEETELATFFEMLALKRESLAMAIASATDMVAIEAMRKQREEKEAAALAAKAVVVQKVA